MLNSLPQQPHCPHLFVTSRRRGFSFWRPVHFDQACRSARPPPTVTLATSSSSCIHFQGSLRLPLPPFYFFSSYSCSFTEPPFLSSPLSLPFVLPLAGALSVVSISSSQSCTKWLPPHLGLCICSSLSLFSPRFSPNLPLVSKGAGTTGKVGVTILVRLLL